jgi:hypothetical protein
MASLGKSLQNQKMNLQQQADVSNLCSHMPDSPEAKWLEGERKVGEKQNIEGENGWRPTH